MSREQGARTAKVPGRIGPGWGRWIGRFVARVYWSTRIVGKERVPRTGPLIVAANHTGWADGPLMIGCTPRGTHILIKIEMFRFPLGPLFRATGQIPVDRTNGRPALATALGVLERGGVVGIFPEGTRGRGDASTARAGVAWLAVHGDAPVVPMAVLGTRRTGESTGKVPGFRRRLYVEFGEPIHVTGIEGLSGREAVAAAQQQIQQALAAHVHAAQERTGLWLPTDDPGEGSRRTDAAPSGD